MQIHVFLYSSNFHPTDFCAHKRPIFENWLVKIRPQKKSFPIICFARESYILATFNFFTLENQRNSGVSMQKKVILVWNRKPLYLNHFLIFFFWLCPRLGPKSFAGMTQENNFFLGFLTVVSHTHSIFGKLGRN
jgi:hypothetical protein